MSESGMQEQLNWEAAAQGLSRSCSSDSCELQSLWRTSLQDGSFVGLVTQCKMSQLLSLRKHLCVIFSWHSQQLVIIRASDPRGREQKMQGLSWLFPIILPHYIRYK